MSATNETEKLENAQIINDLEDVDASKLAQLKAKLNAKTKESEAVSKIVSKKERSLDFFVIGTGQAGSNIASVFYSRGYNAIAVNTAPQDLKSLDLPEINKILISNSSGIAGASRERSLGYAAAKSNLEMLKTQIANKSRDCQAYIVASSLGGGSGSGSLPLIIDILNEIDSKPIIVFGCLAGQLNSDFLEKSNTVEALSDMMKLLQAQKITNFVAIDNAKMEKMFSDVPQFDFFRVANESIVDNFDAFNLYSTFPSAVKSFDPMEVAKTLFDGNGLTIFGKMDVYNYSEETALAEAVVENLNSSCLADGFDLKQSKYVAYILVANKKVWADVKSTHLSYCNAMIMEQTGASGVFRGIYVDDKVKEDCIKLYSIYSGLGLPDSRVQELNDEVKKHKEVIKGKDVTRNLSLNIEDNKSTVSEAEKIKEKIAQKSSMFNRFANKDRR